MTSGPVHRLRVAAVCACLTGLAFRQDPGWVSPDTKVDLTVDPISFLTRSLRLWDASGNFGQLQNQSYGYLWPMGPFHALGKLLNMSPWVVQRLWWALLLCVAFTGVVRLAGKLSLGTSGSRLVAGVAFALSVRTLTELGGISAEAWPSAVAPWVLVPLAGLSSGAGLRRPIARSALAVACAGGVNATAVLAVIPLALLWLFSLPSTRRRFTALAGWCAAVALATLWWVLPLLLFGGYSPPFLDFIETATVTTRVTDIQTVMRGASHWQAYFSDSYGPVWPAGRRLAVDPWIVWSSAVVAALGLAGLARRGMPHRRLLITGLLLGLAMVGFGHVAATAGAFPQWQRALLDGPAVVFRNVHKFDVVIRLPLALGLAHLVGVFMAAAAQKRTELARLRAFAVTAVAVVAVAGVATPALAGGLAARGKYVAIPGYWRQAGAWLDQNLRGDRVLVLPGARFGDYTWGNTGDEVLQSLMDGRWAVRNAIPLTPPGTIRLLDSIEQVLATGIGSPGLAEVLARSGVRYVLVRGDIDYGRVGATAPAIARQAILRSPGLTQVTSFGKPIGASKPGAYVDRGLAGPIAPLEIFEVQREIRKAVAYDLSSVNTIVGGPESLLSLASAGRLGAGPVVLAGDVPAGVALGEVTLTDGLRRREVNFGLGRDNASATLDAKSLERHDAPSPDYLPEWAPDHLVVAGYTGISGVLASESWADAQGLIGNRTAHHPFAAIDGDPATSWRTAPGRPFRGQWIEIRFAGPKVLSEVKLTFDAGGSWLPVKVTVDLGREQISAESFGNLVGIPLGGAISSRMRITIENALPKLAGEGGVGIAEIELPGIKAQRHLVVPAPVAAGLVTQAVFTAAGYLPACYFIGAATVCDPDRRRASEDHHTIARSFSLPTSRDYLPMVWARPMPGDALDKALALDNGYTTTASSSGSAEPVASPAATVDGVIATAWQPGRGDEHPWLRLSWAKPRTITGISLAMDGTVVASRPWAVQVVGDDGLRVGVVDGNGVVQFDRPMTTDEVTVFFLGSQTAYNRDPYRDELTVLPVAIGEIWTLPAQDRAAPDPDRMIDLPCGSGPNLDLGTGIQPTAMRATHRELLELREIPAVLCGSQAGAITLGAGQHLLSATAGTIGAPARVALVNPKPPPAGAQAAVRIDSWSSRERRLSLPESGAARLLAIPENTNPGWQATLDGKVLRPIVVDGWQQGWLLPAGIGGQVVLSFTPQRSFHAALIAGAVGVGLVLLAGTMPGRRRPSPIAGRHRIRRDGLYLFGGLAVISVGGLAGILMTIAGVFGFLLTRWQVRRVSQTDRVKLKRAARRWLWLLPPALFLLGGWLADGSVNVHSATWPQLAGLGAVVVLWLSAYWPLRAGPRPAPVDAWAFDQIPAHGGERHRSGHGHQVHAHRLAAEGWPAGYVVDEMHDERVPEEDAKRDRAKPAHRQGAEEGV